MVGRITFLERVQFLVCPIIMILKNTPPIIETETAYKQGYQLLSLFPDFITFLRHQIAQKSDEVKKKAPRLDYFQARRFFCSLYAFSAAAILRRRHAGVFFEVFAEERLVGEVQFLRNLLDAFLRIA